MGTQREVVKLSGVRTATDDFGGSLKDFPPCDLAATVRVDTTCIGGGQGIAALFERI
ncbi:MAG: hypothetical protein KDK04_28075 [Candidatus Competibacteraceae bacterium]|nr:hypothetical protein [Candidatus Competibacteraceae bacterium]MCB1815544.1 hypothetical protein [Candidatus Competibacteraceae bacterium]